MKNTCETGTILILGVIFGMVLGAMIALMAIADADDKPELSCRDGKLYEVSYEQNITIYDPTFNNCEETK